MAGWINREQLRVTEYPQAENTVLKEQLRASRGGLLFTDKQRRRLAAKAKTLGRKTLARLDTASRFASLGAGR